MPASVDATSLGNSTVLGYKSVARAAPVSTAGPTSIDVLTVNHQLGQSPDQVVVTLRSVVAVVSTAIPNLVHISSNASVAIFHQPVADAGAVAAQYDVVFEKTRSIVS